MKKLTALLALFFSLSSLAAVDIIDFDSAEQEKNYHSLTQELRCPQCQNNNIADSNATIAVDMRHKVLELLKQGNSKQEVVNYMVDRYGHFVTYNPPVTTATIILWVAPILFITLGILLVFRRKPNPIQQKQTQDNHLNHEQQQRLADILNQQKEK